MNIEMGAGVKELRDGNKTYGTEKRELDLSNRDIGIRNNESRVGNWCYGIER